MNSEAQPICSSSDFRPIRDLRRFSLEQLAEQAAEPNTAAADEAERIADSLDSPERVQATIFNSAI